MRDSSEDGGPLVPPAAGGVSGVPDLGTIFHAFFTTGLSGFGGVLPFARRMLVEERRWLSPREFTEILSLCQILPGPNIVCVSIVVGMRFRGLAGAAAAFLGLMLMPVAIVIGLGMLYDRYGDLPAVADAFGGVAAAAAGLVVATAAKIARPYLGSVRVVATALFVFAAMVFLKVPLVLLLLVAAPLSILWTWGSGRG